MLLPLDGKLWAFALDTYRRAGVSDACIALQEGFGADVNLLLFGCWIAVERGVVLTFEDASKAADRVAVWHEDIVCTLRAVRRRLKSGPEPAPNSDSDTLRKFVKAAELQSEHIELAWLEALAPGFTSTADTDALGGAARNLRTILLLTSATAPGSDSSPQVDVILGALRERIDAQQLGRRCPPHLLKGIPFMANDTETLKIIAFPGAPNLPIFAGMEQGFFAEVDINLDFVTTPSSVYQFEQFASGGCDIVFTAFDNIVAYCEGQGAAKLEPIPDFRVIMGATQIELSAIVAPDIKEATDLRGKSLALDAVSTGFAFVLYMLLDHLGLPPGAYDVVAVGATPERWQSVKAGAHAGTIAIEPFTSVAQAAGFNILAKSTDVLPSYQGGIVAAREDWAHTHPELVTAFIGAYLRGLDWVLNSSNREAVANLLLAKMPDIKPDVVDAVLSSVLSPRSGLTPGGEILRDGMKVVLELRSRFGRTQRAFTDIDKYIDLSFFETVHCPAA